MAALIFDFDGTIADSFELAVDIFHTVSGRSKKLTAEEIRTLRGHSTPEILQKLGIRWWQMPRLVSRGLHMAHYRLDEIEPFPGLGPILFELHNRGHRLFIVSSNRTRNIEQFLVTHDIRPFFEKIYGDIGLFGKAKALRKIVREQKIGVQDCVYIGDETRDIRAAQKVDMPVFAVTWGYNNEQSLVAERPSKLIRQPSELLTAL
jgi:phosphoglycolate phosphatase-like HAD superfamily hydrolase